MTFALCSVVVLFLFIVFFFLLSRSSVAFPFFFYLRCLLLDFFLCESTLDTIDDVHECTTPCCPIVTAASLSLSFPFCIEGSYLDVGRLRMTRCASPHSISQCIRFPVTTRFPVLFFFFLLLLLFPLASPLLFNVFFFSRFLFFPPFKNSVHPSFDYIYIYIYTLFFFLIE